MFVEIAIILLILWALGFAFYPIGGLIHVLLIFVLIAVIYHFVTGKSIA
jgi:hypothetical protein